MTFQAVLNVPYNIPFDKKEVVRRIAPLHSALLPYVGSAGSFAAEPRQNIIQMNWKKEEFDAAVELVGKAVDVLGRIGIPNAFAIVINGNMVLFDTRWAEA